MRRHISIFFILAGLSAGCRAPAMPLRNVDYKDPAQVVKSYYDYRRLEQAGVETLKVQSRYFTRTVSLSYYLYTIAQAFESFGRENDAKKLYLRLLLNYPSLHEGGQLGVMTENRLRWLLGDKSWVVASLDELILRLERALQKHDVKTLGRLISRDFGFGRDYRERYAVKHSEGLKMLEAELGGLQHPTVEIVSKTADEQVILKTTGWEHGQKNWYFGLHKNHRLQGWEWDLAYWESALPDQEP
ncbi:hypothetical protein JW933_00740 [candidate division FCPU426 bacterium]|nr:hypothetical protein [candidate division FCPU426 bacterium]